MKNVKTVSWSIVGAFAVAAMCGGLGGCAKTPSGTVGSTASAVDPSDVSVIDQLANPDLAEVQSVYRVVASSVSPADRYANALAYTSDNYSYEAILTEYNANLQNFTMCAGDDLAARILAQLELDQARATDLASALNAALSGDIDVIFAIDADALTHNVFLVDKANLQILELNESF